MTVSKVIKVLLKKGLIVDRQSIYDQVYGATKKIKSKAKSHPGQTMVFNIKPLLTEGEDYTSTVVFVNRRLTICQAGVNKLIEHFKTTHK